MTAFSFDEENVMPLNELPKFFGPDALALMETALDNACRELKNDGTVLDARSATKIGQDDHSSHVGW
jgi:hypothetical protein